MNGHKGIYWGWVIVGASFVDYMVIWGGIWYSFSVFLNIFVRTFNWGRGETAGVFSLCVSIICFGAPIVGRILDRYGPRFILPGAALFLGLSLLMCSRIRTLFDFYLYYGIGCGIGMSFLMFTALTPIISRWFHIYRATAIGLSLSGTGIGMMVFVPLTQEVSNHLGWNGGFLFLSGLVFFLVLPVNLFLLRLPRRGEVQYERGLSFSEKYVGSEKPRVVTVDQAWADRVWTPRKALGTARFWFIFIAGATGTTLVIQTTFSHFIIMTTEFGYTAAFSSRMLGLAGLLASFGFLFWGRLADRIGREWGFTYGTVCIFCGLLCLLTMHWVHGMAIFFVFALLFGFGYGSRAPIMQSICADIFQGPHLSSIFGMYQMSLGVGIVGPWLAGVVAGRLNSYQPVVLSLMASLILACISVWLAAPQDVRRIERGGAVK